MFWCFSDFPATGAQNLILHSKTKLCTLEALEANSWHTKTKKKDTINLLHKQRLHDSRNKK